VATSSGATISSEIACQTGSAEYPVRLLCSSAAPVVPQKLEESGTGDVTQFRLKAMRPSALGLNQSRIDRLAHVEYAADAVAQFARPRPTKALRKK
jgi:hypothetical protein